MTDDIKWKKRTIFPLFEHIIKELIARICHILWRMDGSGASKMLFYSIDRLWNTFPKPSYTHTHTKALNASTVASIHLPYYAVQFSITANRLLPHSHFDFIFAIHTRCHSTNSNWNHLLLLSIAATSCSIKAKLTTKRNTQEKKNSVPFHSVYGEHAIVAKWMRLRIVQMTSHMMRNEMIGMFKDEGEKWKHFSVVVVVVIVVVVRSTVDYYRFLWISIEIVHATISDLPVHFICSSDSIRLASLFDSNKTRK